MTDKNPSPPERLWAHMYAEIWEPQPENGTVEYIRADIYNKVVHDFQELLISLDAQDIKEAKERIAVMLCQLRIHL